jgi:hypothetical protein
VRGGYRTLLRFPLLIRATYERQAHFPVHDFALAELDFSDAVRLLGIAAVVHVLNQKDPGARHSQISSDRMA